MSNPDSNSNTPRISAVGAAVNRVIDEAWSRDATRFSVQPADRQIEDAAMMIDGQPVIDTLGVDFQSLRQRLIDLAIPKRGMFGGSRADAGAFRLKIGDQQICITVDTKAMEERVDCGVYVPRDFAADSDGPNH